jgi:hypothetical protein
LLPIRPLFSPFTSRFLPSSMCVQSVVVSHDGARLLSCHSRTLPAMSNAAPMAPRPGCMKVWESGTWTLLSTIECEHGVPLHATWSPYGKFLAVDEWGGSLRTSSMFKIFGIAASREAVPLFSVAGTQEQQGNLSTRERSLR